MIKYWFDDKIICWITVNREILVNSIEPHKVIKHEIILERIQSCFGNSLVIKDYTQQGVPVCLSEVLIWQNSPKKGMMLDINYWKKHAFHILVPSLVSELKKYNSLLNSWVSQYFSACWLFFFPPLMANCISWKSIANKPGYLDNNFFFFLSNILNQHVIFTSQQGNEIINGRFGLKCSSASSPFLLYRCYCCRWAVDVSEVTWKSGFLQWHPQHHSEQGCKAIVALSSFPMTSYLKKKKKSIIS